jgi:GGDEF domain-containing protein
MSAVEDTMKKGYGGLWRLVRLPCSFPLLSMPLPLIGYVLSVVACYLALFGWEAARTPRNAADLALFAALMCCGEICVEATRRLGQPTGVTRGLLSAWWLPVALLLPPVYALAAPARTDAKTGLLNVTAWQREAEAAIATALRHEEPLALLLADVDHFKEVNDTFGHLTGDEVLRALAAELTQRVKETDYVGRFGGKEFVVLLPKTRAEGGVPHRRPASPRRVRDARPRGRRHGGRRHDLDRRRVARRARPGPVRAPRGVGSQASGA